MARPFDRSRTVLIVACLLGCGLVILTSPHRVRSRPRAIRRMSGRSRCGSPRRWWPSASPNSRTHSPSTARFRATVAGSTSATGSTTSTTTCRVPSAAISPRATTSGHSPGHRCRLLRSTCSTPAARPLFTRNRIGMGSTNAKCFCSASMRSPTATPFANTRVAGSPDRKQSLPVDLLEDTERSEILDAVAGSRHVPRRRSRACDQEAPARRRRTRDAYSGARPDRDGALPRTPAGGQRHRVDLGCRHHRSQPHTNDTGAVTGILRTTGVRGAPSMRKRVRWTLRWRHPFPLHGTRRPGTRRSASPRRRQRQRRAGHPGSARVR